MERLNSIHLKQFLSKLIDNEDTNKKVLELVNQYIKTTKEDQNKLVQGLQILLDQPEEGRKQAEFLIEQFGKMPAMVLSKN